MNKCTRYLLLLLLNVPVISAKYAKRDTLERNSVLGCALYLSKINNWDERHSYDGQFYGSICRYTPAFQSWAYCIFDSLNDLHENLNNRTFDKSLAQIQATCSEINPNINNITIPEYHNILQNASNHIRKNYKSNDPESRIKAPISVNKTTRLSLINAYHDYFYNLDESNFYVYYYYIYFFIFFSCASIINYLNHTNQSQKLQKYKIWCNYKGIFIRSLYKGYHTSYYNFYKNAFIGLFPTVLETCLISNYAILNSILLAVNYKLDPTCTIFKTKTQQFLRLLADRSGILAFGNLPIIFIFCTRNNLLLGMTDFSYATFITLHKWVGRIMILNSLIHSVSYLLYSILSGSLDISKLQLYYQCGIIAMVLATLIFFLSLGYLRKQYYETFLYSHIILCIGFMIACWKHVENLGWKNWLIISILFWIFERFTRVVNILRNGGILKSKISLIENVNDEEDNLVRVVIKKKSNCSLKPGQYFFVFFIHPLIFWQSHPFTIVEIEDGGIIIVLKPKSGASNTIYNSLLKNNGLFEIKVALEGPYGHCSPIRHSDNILLLAAGTGIPGPLFHALDLSQKLRDNDSKKIKLVIIVRSSAILLAFKEEILLLRNRNIDIEIYLTRYTPIKVNNNHRLSDETSSLMTRNFNIEDFKTFTKVSFGRPNLEKIVESATEPQKSLSVLACGAPVFVDSLRDMISTVMIDHPNSSIDYHEEFQRW